MDDIKRGFSSWLQSPWHRGWLSSEGNRLLGFAKASRLAQGFGNLDDNGRLPLNAHAETMNTARMTHSFALAHIRGIPGCAALVDHGVASLSGPLRDAEHGGWFDKPLEVSENPGKAAYLHAFVAWPPARRWWPNAREPMPCWPMPLASSRRISGAKKKARCVSLSPVTGATKKPIAVPTATCTARKPFLRWRM